MRILVDGDAAGHRDFLVAISVQSGSELVWVCNYASRPPVEQDGLNLRVVLTDLDDQAADMVLMNLAQAGDIVITGDLGLATVCVAKGAAAIGPRGFWYRHEDLAQRLEWRALAARLRRGGINIDKKPAARRLDDWRFEQELRLALETPSI